MKIKILLSLLFFTSKILATDYYISNAGNDSNNGTSSSTPWQTLEKLSSELGGTSGTWGTISNGDRILFNKGDVFRGIIAFSAYNNSGITFDSYGTGTTAIIKGSKQLTNWTIHNGNVWKTNLNQRAYFLFINNIKQTLARMPNTGTWNISSSSTNSINCNNISSSGINYVGANICIREYDWRLNRQVVASQSANTVNWTNSINAAGTNANFYFDNKLEFIDTIGEWFYDMPTQTLYLSSSTNPNTLSVEASVNLLGIAGNDNRSDNVIQNIQFEHYAENAIQLKGASNNNTIQNCKFKNNLNSFFVSGSNMNIQNNEISEAYLQGMLLANMTNSNIISNSITNVGIDFGKHRPDFTGDFYSSGIWLIQGNNLCKIANNTITNCGYNGIRFGGSGILIEKNYLENILLNMDDGGALYTYGNDAFNCSLKNNIIKNVIGDHNGISPGGIVNGIYIDNYAHNIEIINNTIDTIIKGSGILINAGSYGNNILNNTTYKCKEGITFADWMAGASIYNNTLSNNTFYANLENAIPILIASTDNNYNVLSNSNNNFLVNPYNDKIVQYAWSSSQSFTLNQWRQLNSSNNFDINSVGSFYNWVYPVDNSFIIYNNTNNNITYNYSNTVNLNNNSVTSIILEPFTSKVLISTIPLTINKVAKNINNYSVFPNPTNNFVTITSNNLTENEEFSFYNSNGQLLFKNNVIPKTFNLENYSNGIYYLKLGSTTIKVVKK